MSVFWRSWLTVCSLAAVVLALLAGLTTLQYDAILSHLIQGRLAVLAQTSRGSFNAALSLGLPLPAVRNAGAILERARQTDPQIVALHVFDPTGIILYSTDPDHSTSVRSEVLFAWSQSREDLWYTETDEYLLSGAGFRHGASNTTGGLVIVYPRSELSTPVRAMMTRLAAHGIAVMFAVALVAGAVLRFGLRDLVRVFESIEQTFAALEQREWRRAAGGSHPLPEPIQRLGIDTGELTRMVIEADTRYVEAGHMLSALQDGRAAQSARHEKA